MTDPRDVRDLTDAQLQIEYEALETWVGSDEWHPTAQINEVLESLDAICAEQARRESAADPYPDAIPFTPRPGTRYA